METKRIHNLVLNGLSTERLCEAYDLLYTFIENYLVDMLLWGEPFFTSINNVLYDISDEIEKRIG